MEKLHVLGQNREQNLHVQFEGTVGQQRWGSSPPSVGTLTEMQYFHAGRFSASVLTQKCQPADEADNPGVTNLVPFKNV